MSQISSLPTSILRRAKQAKREHPDALVAVLSADGIFLYNSASSEAILGYPPGYALGHNITEFYQPAEAAHFNADDWRCIAGGRIHDNYA